MMNEATIKFIISRVFENAKDAAEEAKQNKDDDFYRGRMMAYYEILDTIKNEMDVREADLQELGLDINLEKTFII